jgi:hypothetical protein
VLAPLGGRGRGSGRGLGGGPLPGQPPAVRGGRGRQLRGVRGPDRALVRVFLATGWSVSDLLVYALDHAPDGAAHWHTTPVHSPAG